MAYDGRVKAARAAAGRRGLSAVLRWVLRAAFLLVGLWLALIVAYRWVEPPLTPLMMLRLAEVSSIGHRPRPLAQIAPALAIAVIAAEDNNFCRHRGIDWSAVGEALEDYEQRGRLRGASTITMQTARNLFLWPGGGLMRKTIEAPLALAIDFVWPKRRIIEVYLNVIEWGPGLFGAEAAARHYFGKPASTLSSREAVLLAAILPNPRRWSAARPSAYIHDRAERIERRMDQLGGLAHCAR